MADGYGDIKTGFWIGLGLMLAFAAWTMGRMLLTRVQRKASGA